MGISRRTAFFTALILTGLLLAGGSVVARMWWMSAGALGLVLFGWLGERSGWRWMPHALLILYLAAAGGGVLMGGHPALLIGGAAAALMCWDLAPDREAPDSKVDPRHLTILSAAVLTGVLTAEAGLLSRMVLPYGLVILAGLLVLFGLYRYYQSTHL